MTHDRQYDLLVYIGRFQPFHNIHYYTIRKALEISNRVLVLIGSSNTARNTKNPFTYEERKLMISECFNFEEAKRIDIEPIDDFPYNESAWLTQVREIIRDNIDPETDSKVGFIGKITDDSTYYLNMFPDYGLEEIDLDIKVHATDLRNIYYNNGLDVDGEYFLKMFCHNKVLDFLKTFQNENRYIYNQLKQEHEFIKNYKKGWEAAPYPPTFVTADAVVVCNGHLLVIRRKANPGKGTYALPGGFVNQNETVKNAAIRELKEETKIKIPVPVLEGSITKEKMYDHPGRSLRGRTITSAYLIELKHEGLPKVKGSDDADLCFWMPLEDVLESACSFYEDHYHIICDMLELTNL